MARRILILGGLVAAGAGARAAAPLLARTIRRARTQPVRAAVTVEGERATIEARLAESGLRQPPSDVRLRDATGGRGTVVEIVQPPAAGGPIAAALAPLARVRAGAEHKAALRQLKQLIETGETPTTEGQPSGRGRDGAHAPTASSAGSQPR